MFPEGPSLYSVCFVVVLFIVNIPGPYISLGLAGLFPSDHVFFSRISNLFDGHEKDMNVDATQTKSLKQENDTRSEMAKNNKLYILFCSSEVQKLQCVCFQTAPLELELHFFFGLRV